MNVFALFSREESGSRSMQASQSMCGTLFQIRFPVSQEYRYLVILNSILFRRVMGLFPFLL